MVKETKIYKNFNIKSIHKDSIILIGNFDGVHLGHQKLFSLAKSGRKPSTGRNSTDKGDALFTDSGWSDEEDDKKNRKSTAMKSSRRGSTDVASGRKSAAVAKAKAKANAKASTLPFKN